MIVSLTPSKPVDAAVPALCQTELAAAPDEPTRSHPTHAQLIGAWRLVRIESTGPDGPVADAFFEKDSAGLIVYDASGWVSVQISGSHRVPWEVPVTRSPARLDQNLRLKAAAYDSYYAYFGTWDYDPTTAVMTHHVKSSVIPAELGLDYAQRISLTGNCMTFTGHADDHGLHITRTKVWQRVSNP